MYHNVVIPLHAEIAAFFGRKNTNFGALSLPATSVCLSGLWRLCPTVCIACGWHLGLRALTQLGMQLLMQLKQRTRAVMASCSRLMLTMVLISVGPVRWASVDTPNRPDSAHQRTASVFC